METATVALCVEVCCRATLFCQLFWYPILYTSPSLAIQRDLGYWLRVLLQKPSKWRGVWGTFRMYPQQCTAGLLLKCCTKIGCVSASLDRLAPFRNAISLRALGCDDELRQ